MNIQIVKQQELEKLLNNNTIEYCFHKTPAGLLKIFAIKDGIYKATFDKDEIPKNYVLNKYIDKTRFILSGTKFQIKVWQKILELKDNQISNYEEIAKSIGFPKAYRAVANALAQNNIAYFIPCHKIIRKDKSLGGYKWGIQIKQKLLSFIEDKEPI